MEGGCARRERVGMSGSSEMVGLGARSSNWGLVERGLEGQTAGEDAGEPAAVVGAGVNEKAEDQRGAALSPSDPPKNPERESD